ncbi:ANTAR domain-containing protein [Amycolatopsis sp. lyj-23]|uniref:ANTAR domain-containing protein n=1 Tax=Amycolatopsis sp. lyj-23 TaxID=2789283 RepID=UPI00397B16E3
MTESLRGVRPPLWSIEVVRRGERPVVVVTGELDLGAHPGFGERLQELTAGAADPVVDLSRVRLLTAAGVRQLLVVADALARGGRHLRVVTGSAVALRVLRATQATDVLETSATLEAAEHALQRLREADAGTGELEQLRREVTELRAKLATRPVIARALGMVQERYRLADLDEAFRLLRFASRTHNVKLFVLAQTLVELPRPRDRAWLIGALQRPAPPLDLAARRAGAKPVAVLEQLVQEALRHTGAAAGYAQLPDGTGLRLAVHRGLGPDFATAFAHLDGEQSTCTAAHVRGVPVHSADIARDAVFSRPGPRHALLADGFGTARSTPLATPTTGSAGVLTTLHEGIDHPVGVPATERVETLCRQTGAWLTWYRHHEVLTALQDLHARVTAGKLG